MDFKEFKNKYQKASIKEYPHVVSADPVVSICVQTYQHKDFIEQCLENILSQKTTFEFEILLSEDDSQDGTRQICIEYAEKYPEKIRLFLHDRLNQIRIQDESTGNFPSFYNLYSARGKYIAVCEGDDFWGDPWKLQKQIDFLEKNPAYSFVFHRYQLIDENGSPIDEISHQPEEDICEEDLVKIEYHPLFLTVCFRNNFQEYPLQITKVINIDSFLLSLLGQQGKAKFQSGISPSFHRIHRGGIWGKRKKDKKFISKTILYSNLEEYYKRNQEKSLSLYFKYQKTNMKKSLLFYYLKNGKLWPFLKKRTLLILSNK